MKRTIFYLSKNIAAILGTARLRSGTYPQRDRLNGTERRGQIHADADACHHHPAEPMLYLLLYKIAWSSGQL